MRSFLRNRRFKNFASKSDVLCFCLLLNSKASNYIPLAGYTLSEKSFLDYLQGRDGKVTFFTFYSASDCPFSFSQGFCIAFNSPAIFSDKVFVLVGFDRGGTKIETKQITIK